MRIHACRSPLLASSLLLALLWLTAVPARSEEICTFPAPTDIRVDKELLMTDLSVVNDPRASGADGAWSFGGLMAALAPNDAPALVKQWLDSFGRRQDINGFPLLPRPAMQQRLIRRWMAKDGAAAFAAWTPNLANAPFRLLAIVYRPDLGVVDRDGTIRSAGEARFVFTALDLSRTDDLARAAPLPFTVIFEYGLNASNRESVKAWAERWHRLGGMEFGASYNTALQAITDSFARAPRGSGDGRLNQIRTNEGLSLPWQLREFHLDAQGPRLVNAPLKDTPPRALLSSSRELIDAISNRPDDDLPKKFLAGSAEVPEKGFRWPQAGIANNVLRHNFAFRTCNGCHGQETGVKADDHPAEQRSHRGFRHISGRMHDERARLSEFMTGDPALVTDGTGKIYTFCDLKIRQQALHEALNPKPAAAQLPAADDLSVAHKRRERSD